MVFAGVLLLLSTLSSVFALLLLGPGCWHGHATRRNCMCLLVLVCAVAAADNAVAACAVVRDSLVAACAVVRDRLVAACAVVRDSLVAACAVVRGNLVAACAVVRGNLVAACAVVVHNLAKQSLLGCLGSCEVYLLLRPGNFHMRRALEAAEEAVEEVVADLAEAAQAAGCRI